MSANTANQNRLYQVILAPQVTEKATRIADKHQQIAFKVRTDATKPEVKAAVELLFKVEVDSVSVVNVKGKTKRTGRMMGHRQDWKKAYVSLKPGQEINFAAGEKGLPLCRPGVTTLTTARRPGEVGLTLISAMIYLLFARCKVNFLTWLQAHISFFPVLAATHYTACALFLALNIGNCDGFYLNFKH